MRVHVDDRERAYDELIRDDVLQELVGEIVSHPALTGFVASVLTNFHTAEDVQMGKGATSGKTLTQWASPWGKTPGDRSSIRRMVSLFEDLYGRYHGGNLRGIILEQIVERRMAVRYGSNCLVSNNAVFRVTNGAAFDSAPNSIDVLAFDPSADRGECHNCKVQARHFGSERDFIERLVRGAVPLGLRLGLVVAQETSTARRQLARAGIPWPAARLVTHEDWLNALPLQS